MTVLYITAAIIILFFFMQWSMVKGAQKSKGLKLTGLSSNLKRLEQKGSMGLVYFFSPSCHACKAQTSVINSMQSENKNIYAVDISQDLQTARIFGIKATPTTILVKDGIVNQVLVGAKPRRALEELMNS